MKYQLTRCSSTTLKDVPIQDGQIIYVKDTGEHYLDVDTQRIKVTNKTLEQNVQDIINSLNTKVEQTSEINKIYGTNETGNQTTFNKDDLNKVDDVQVDGISVIQNKVANIDIQSLKTELQTDIDSLGQVVDTNKTNMDKSIEDINTVIEELTNTVDINKKDTDKSIEDINTQLENLNTTVDENKGNTDTSIKNIQNSIIDLQDTKLDKTFASNVDNSITASIEFIPSGQKNGVYIKETMLNPIDSTTQEFGSYLYSSTDDIVYTGKEDGIDTTIPKLNTLEETINTNKTETDKSMTDLTETVSNNKEELQKSINTNSSNISQLQTSVETLETNVDTNTEDINTLQTQVETNTGNITTNIEDINTLKSNVSELQTSVEDNAQTITTMNSSITQNTNDIQSLTTRVTLAENNITENTTNISNNTQSIGNINTTLENQADSISVLETQTETNRVTTQANTVAIQGLVNQFDTYHHYFQGYYEHTADIQELEAERGDYAYNGETNTIWAFDTVWSDTFDPIPSDMGGKTQTTPLMDGEASVGTENYYAAGDHRHPTDITRASVEDLTAHINNKTNPHSVTKEQVGLSNVDNTSDVNKPISTATQNALDLKQNITDNTLLTDSKIIPNSINELYTDLKSLQDLMAQTYLIYKHNSFEIANGKTINFQLREFVDIDDAMIIDENYAYTNSKNTYRLLSTESSITEFGFCSNGWIGFIQNGIEYVYLNQKFMEMFARELGMTNEGYQGDGWYKYTMSFGSGVINMDFEKINYTQLSNVQTMKISSITKDAEATPVTSINSNNLQYIANFIKIVE